MNGREVAYLLVTSSVARNVRLAIKRGGELSVTRPQFLDESVVSGFMRDKASWIISKIDALKDIKPTPLSQAKKADYKKYKTLALAIVKDKIKRFNAIYNFRVNKVFIRNQKSRWGSCSRKANLNFNFRIIYLDERLSDYIVVHELCHIGELNHSKKFWSLVSLAFPDYRALRKKLRETA